MEIFSCWANARLQGWEVIFFRENIGCCLLIFLESENLAKSHQRDDWIQFDRSFIVPKLPKFLVF